MDRQLAPDGSYGCASCYQQPSKYTSGCKECLRQFSSSSTTTAASVVAARKLPFNKMRLLLQKCYACVGKAHPYAGYYCSNMVSNSADHPCLDL